MTRLFMIGDTVKMTLVHSGTTVGSATAALFNGSGTLVSCGAMTASGNGHFYKYMTLPTSPGYYAAEMRAVDSAALPFIRRVTIQAAKMEVD